MNDTFCEVAFNSLTYFDKIHFKVFYFKYLQYNMKCQVLYLTIYWKIISMKFILKC